MPGFKQISGMEDLPGPLKESREIKSAYSLWANYKGFKPLRKLWMINAGNDILELAILPKLPYVGEKSSRFSKLTLGIPWDNGDLGLDYRPGLPKYRCGISKTPYYPMIKSQISTPEDINGLLQKL